MIWGITYDKIEIIVIIMIIVFWIGFYTNQYINKKVT